jgi:nucleoside-diphosphate-sugar epimerase
MNAGNRKILVLGASGLIGRFVTDDLRARGFSAVGVARRLSASQKSGPLDLELPVMSMEAAQLARLLRDHRIDIVVNCLGVLRDGPGSDTAAVHRDFAATATVRSGWCISRFPAPPRPTARPSAPPSARRSG